MRIVLPWPDRRLWPNYHVHWRVKERARKEAIEAGYVAAREVYVLGEDPPLTGELLVTYHIYPPSRRSFDDDGCIGALKHYRDGVARGLAVNDRQFHMQTPEIREVVPGGQIVMEIEEV
jgi:crossover junction endodeoxyribonuclease RusA